jgi:hypothetical protein
MFSLPRTVVFGAAFTSLLLESSATVIGSNSDIVMIVFSVLSSTVFGSMVNGNEHNFQRKLAGGKKGGDCSGKKGDVLDPEEVCLVSGYEIPGRPFAPGTLSPICGALTYTACTSALPPRRFPPQLLDDGADDAFECWENSGFGSYT